MKTKLLIPLIAFLIMSSILSPLAQASETNNDSTVDQETKDALADELQFYFEEVGYFDENNQYIITDINKLEERANTGDETANQLLNQTKENLSSQQIQTYSAKSYAGCILADTFGVQIALLNGDLVDTLVGYIQDQWWQAAAELIIVDVLGKTLSKANAVATGAQLALSAYSCRGEL